MNTKRVLLFLAFFVVVGIVITARSGGPAAILGQGYTLAPSETNCTTCHSGGSFGTVSPVIEIFQQGTSTPVTAYTPGTAYDMRVSVNHTSGSPVRFGFQMTALRVTGNLALAGYSNLAANVHQAPANGRTYVEHSSPQASNQFTFRWTAPAAGSGSVRFYASGNCVNNDGAPSGDAAASSSLLITEAIPLAVSGTKVDVTCFGANNGSINITASGGVPSYSYLWSDGNTNEDRTGLAPGTYSVTVTDAASATATSSSFTITQPTDLVLTATIGTILCHGGTTTVTIGGSGGTPTYTGTGISTLSAGTYTRVITDSKGCTEDTTFTITQPDSIHVTATVNGQIPCTGAGTTVTVGATGGTGILSGTGTFSVFTPGNVTYTVTDGNNCSKSVTVNVQAVSGLTVTTTLDMPGCLDSCAGVLTSNISTTSLPVTETLASIPGGQTISNFNTLCPGSYAYTVTDNAGCTYTDTLEIASPQPPFVTLEGITPANGGSNGSIDISVIGGQPPYTYEWSNSATIQDIGNLAPGTYSVTVTGANDCETTLGGLVLWDEFGIDEVQETVLGAFPNPFGGQFQLSQPGYPVVAVRDISGRKVPFVQTGQSVRLQNHVSGIYFVEIKSGDKILVLKIMAE